MKENLVADDVLKNKPLIEAILEIKWAPIAAIGSEIPGIKADPNYKIFLGRFYDRVSGDYPEIESLATATMPEEISWQVVQHRYRIGPKEWPLIQVGPGILTLNDTYKYKWSDFRLRSIMAISKLFEAHPKQSELKIQDLLLRYINAVELDQSSENILTFLKEKMRIEIRLPDSLFTDPYIQKNPKMLMWQSSFACDKPDGFVTVRFSTAQKEGRPGLMWETMVHSIGQNISISGMPEKFQSWIDAAHDSTHSWFFKLIEGDLKKRFRGE